MKSTKPPFRADQVGSFLRSTSAKETQTRRASGELMTAGAADGPWEMCVPRRGI